MDSATGTERRVAIPSLSLVVLIGPSGSGKSTFAARHFDPAEILSVEAYRAAIGDDPDNQTATEAALDALRNVAGTRLALGYLTVIDATNLRPQDRAPLVHIAHQHDVLPVAIALNLDERVCAERDAARSDRPLDSPRAHDHARMRYSAPGLQHEGFRQVIILDSPEDVEAVRIERVPLLPDRRAEMGPFDIIGDIHGCYEELRELLALLGYEDDAASGMRHPLGRRAIFLGDLVDRGSGIVETVNLARRMVAAGQALCVPGNHDVKLLRYLTGRHVHIAHGLEQSIVQIEALPTQERATWTHAYIAFVDGLVPHYVLDGGALVVAHAGMKQAYQGRVSGRIREFALYGETTGKIDEFGLPVRGDWAASYHGSAAVIYGHTPIYAPIWLNNTLNIDTGCIFGGRLTALRWPERELLSVPARATYAKPKRPLRPASDDGHAGSR